MQVIVLPQTIHDVDKVLIKATTHSAGHDIVYFGPRRAIKPGALDIIGTGIFIAIPHGYEGQIRPRSSMGAKGIIIPNAPGTIDSDYRGEIKIILLNLSGKEQVIENSNRIAQIIFSKVIDVDFSYDHSSVPESNRLGGFGSTGK